MITVTISIRPYLASYMYVRYGQSLESPAPIHLSHISPLYHLLYQLSVPHPLNTSWKEKGNICFDLPHPKTGKNPIVYNYIGQDSAHLIEKEIEVEMRMELYEFLLENKFKNGVTFTKSMEEFVEHYKMEELVQEESLMRAFKRWRKEVREKRKEVG